jgi:hypothetical protein
MIARRFSSAQFDPQAYFACKRHQEAKDRGEYVDIHDIIGPLHYWSYTFEFQIPDGAECTFMEGERDNFRGR